MRYEHERIIDETNARLFAYMKACDYAGENDFKKVAMGSNIAFARRVFEKGTQNFLNGGTTIIPSYEEFVDIAKTHYDFMIAQINIEYIDPLRV